MKKYEQQLEQAWNRYQATVNAIVDQAFKEVVQPYCQKHSLRFLAGNGTYFMQPLVYQGSIASWIPPQLPKRVAQVLEIEIPGMRADSLGTLMPNFPDTC